MLMKIQPEQLQLFCLLYEIKTLFFCSAQTFLSTPLFVAVIAVYVTVLTVRWDFPNMGILLCPPAEQSYVHFSVKGIKILLHL